tara:strand:+ start:2314 stop:3801 length:1488 start_codon:yes stop_codon:yes gene_type:complete
MSTFVIFGNQLFHPQYLKEHNCSEVFMAEDNDLCTFVKHHKLKLYLFLTAMREYKDELENAGIKVHYNELNSRNLNETYFQCLEKFILKKGLKEINIFEIEDKPAEEGIYSLEKKGISITEHKSPMFLFSRPSFKEFHEGKKTFRMAPFYKFGRKELNLLMANEHDPQGGKWSFDEENRKKIPKGTDIPVLPNFRESKHHQNIIDLIEENFGNHPGSMENIWFPVNRKGAKKALSEFLDKRIENFGIYEDAMLEEENFLFHSTLSPFLNIGLITPQEIIEMSLKAFEKNKIPLNSIEGFIRQIIGWREFIRGIYQEKGEFQKRSNFWEHKNKLTDSWYEGNTGIVPLDDCIKTTLKDGYHHHIPRLMVISNIMNMCEIDPDEIYKWFMEMFIDSSDWVMIPNVYGMATYSDGGLMSTKPYTCGSNYFLKMSNYKKGDWCDIVDGLYWRFTEKHRAFYEKNARMGFLTRTLDRMDKDRKTLIFKSANDFIKNNTQK